MIELINEKNNINIQEMSYTIGMTTRTIEKNLRILKNAGKVIRVGNRKIGHWEIVE